MSRDARSARETPKSSDPERAAPDPADLLAREEFAGLGALVAIVAHEIHNPITYVLGSLHSLQELLTPLEQALAGYRRLAAQVAECPPDIARLEEKLEEAGGLEELATLLEDSLDGAQRIRGLVRDLLTLSRSRGRGSGPVDVNEVLKATLRLVSREVEARARLEQDLEASGSVGENGARLGQVFLNLLTNALEACEPPDPSRHRILVRTRDTRRGVEVEVHDTGVGIPSGGGSRVFDPFFTTKAAGGGAGLGLYLCRRIVEDCGGAIGHQPGPNGGTVFTVVIPAWGESWASSERSR